MADTRSRPPLETIRYARMRLAVTQGPDAGLVLERAGTTVTVGKAESADLRMRDETVSHIHCEIVLDELGFRIRDLDSTNGLHINGLRVFDVSSSAPLNVTVGESVLAITPLAEAEPRERSNLGSFGPLLGEAPKMRELFALLARVSPTDLTILIEGETGTGKELVAHAIHQASARAAGEFVVFDCSSVAATLMESDLFGHERGAFTGAHASRVGALEEARAGTLFLDEIGELPLDLQQKLLRCLQSGEYRRVGGRKLEKSDVRVIAATNRNLRSEVAAGRFRQDLYYRLEGVPIHVPPLRDRIEDIPLLTQHFLGQSDPGLGRPQLPAHALEMFRAHRWPGNVRELANVVRRMQLLPDLPFRVEHHDSRETAQNPQVSAPLQHRPLGELEQVAHKLGAWRSLRTAPDPEQWLPLEAARRLVQDAFERDYLSLLQQLSRSNRTRAAAWGGVTRQAIQRLVRKHDLDWDDDETELEPS